MTVRAERRDPSATTLIAGRYRLVDLIAMGARGSVWRAMDQTLARAVALKLHFASAEQDNDALPPRFLREARIAASVRHKNVVEILDFGTTEQARPFTVMELIEGESLQARMHRAPPLTLREMVTLTAGILDGLFALHRAGVVHRDLEPANVLLVPREGAELRAMLLDFGVSHPVEPGSAHRSVLTTNEGLPTGAHEYMSPEQARGAKLDLRADLYSVGAILYEGLTGRLPYENERAGGRLIDHAAAPAVALRPEVGEPISAVVARALAPQPDDRYATAHDMRDALLRAAERSHPMRISSIPVLRSTRTLQRTDGRPAPIDETLAIVRAVAPPRRPRRWLLAGLIVASLGGTWMCASAVRPASPAREPAPKTRMRPSGSPLANPPFAASRLTFYWPWR